MGGRNRLYVTNLCEDSLLASPSSLDLTILAELMTRITYKAGAEDKEWNSMYSVLSLLSYSLKPPLSSLVPMSSTRSTARGPLAPTLCALVSVWLRVGPLAETRTW